jgi:hypothetical protein
MTPEQRVQAIADRDDLVAGFSRRVVCSLKFPMGLLVWFVNQRESKDTINIVSTLSNEDWQNTVKDRVYTLLRRVEEEGLDLSQRDTQLMNIPKELLG